MTSTRSSFFQSFRLSVKDNVINLSDPPLDYKPHRKSSTGTSSIASDGGSFGPSTDSCENSPSHPNRGGDSQFSIPTLDLVREADETVEDSTNIPKSYTDMKKRPSLASFFGFASGPATSKPSSQPSELVVDVPKDTPSESLEATRPSVIEAAKLNIFNKPVEPSNNHGGVVRRYSFLNAFTSPQPPSPEMADAVKMHSMEELLGFSEEDQRLSTTRDFNYASFESSTIYSDPTVVDPSSKSFDIVAPAEPSTLGLSISNRSTRGAGLMVPPPVPTSPRSETSKQTFTMLFSSSGKNYEFMHLNFQTILDRLEGKDDTLTEVDLNSSPLFSKSSEYYEQLAKALKSNRRVEKIEMANIAMDEIECEKFISVFASCTHLKKLNLESNHLPSASIEALALMAETHPALTELRLGSQKSVRTDRQGDKALANCLSQNFNIVKLTHKFHDKRIASYVAKCIKRNINYARPSNLLAPRVPDTYPYPRDRTSSHLSDISRGPSMTQRSSLAAVGASETLKEGTVDAGGSNNPPVQKRKSLLGRMLSGTSSTSEPTVSGKARELSAEVNQFNTLLSKLEKNDTSVTTVSIKNTVFLIQQSGCFDGLCRALTRNISVTKLELTGVSLHDEHTESLCKALASCINLKVVNLENNSLTTIGVQTVARMMEIHPSILELRLGQQAAPIGIDGERALANALSQNTRVTKLVFNFRDKTVSMYIDKFLHRNAEYEKKQRLSLQEGPVSPTAVKASIPGFDLFSPTRNDATGSFKGDPYPFTVDKGISKYFVKR